MKRKILYIDPCNSVRKLVRILLQKAGCEVIEAISAEEAMTILSRLNIALIITDLNIPGMNGIELTQALQSRMPQLRPPILLLTSHLDAAVQKKARAAGIEEWLAKPFDSQNLIQTVTRLIEKTDCAA